MQPNFKLVLMDLDGTTVAAASDAMPSPRVIDAVQKAQEKVHVAVVTGRWLKIMQSIADELGLKGPSVLSGGAQVHDFSTGRDVLRQELSPEILREAAALVLPFGYLTLVIGADYQLELNDATQIKQSAFMLQLSGVATRDAGHIADEANKISGAIAHMANSWSGKGFNDIHITHKEASKRHGVEHLIKHYGVKQEEVLAIGDNHNDLPLFEAAGFKVAMGNAEEALKQAADHIAPSLDNDGVADTIERFILAEPK